MQEGSTGYEAMTRRNFLLTGSASGALLVNGTRSDNAGRDDSLLSGQRAAVERRDVSFTSSGADLSAWLYRPDVRGSCPLVVMAHGYSATRRMTADKYAEAFCAAGAAVLLFDHRGFGASGGEPRRQINTWLQARGYLDAIRFAPGLADIDPSRIAVWGDSLSGGVALIVAAIDPAVAALVVQVPALGAELPPSSANGELFRRLRETVLTGRIEPTGEDEIDGPMPVVSDDPVRRPCALPPLTAYRWFIEYGGRFGSGWLNDVTRARPRTPAPWHPGLAAPHVSCPSLFVVSPNDEMHGAVPAVSRDAFDKLRGPKQWVEIEGGPFGLVYHPSAEFDRASSAQTRFIVDQLITRG